MFGIAGHPAVTQSTFKSSDRHMPTEFIMFLDRWRREFFWQFLRKKNTAGKTKGGGKGANNAGSVGEEEKGSSVRDDGKGQRAGIVWAKDSLLQNSTAIITQKTNTQRETQQPCHYI